MIRFSRQPLRVQVAIAALLLTLPLVGAAIWAASATYRERSAEVREQAASTAATVKAYLDRHLQATDSIAAALVRHPSVKALDRTACDRLFADLLPQYGFLLNVVLTGRDGYNRGTGLPWSDPSPAYSGDQPYFLQVLASGKLAVGEFQTGRISRRPTIILGYPVLDDRGDLAAVLGLGLRLDTLQEVFGSVPLPEGSVVTLTDRTSMILARSLDAERYIGTRVDPASFQEPASVPRVVVRTGVDGVERIFGNAVVERGPWLLSVGIPTSVAAARARASWRRSLLIVLIGIAAYVCVALVVARAVTRPLDKLEASARLIAQGDLTPPAQVDAPTLELARLQQSFIIMASHLREAREAIDRQLAMERQMRQALQSLQRQTVRQERLAAVGQLVSGVAHELNNPLQVIIGVLDLLEQQKRVPKDLEPDLQVIQSESLRAGEIIKNLLTFVRQEPSPVAPVDIRDVINSVVRLREGDLERKHMHLDVLVGVNRPVHAVFSELQQVVLNFLVNAEQALDGWTGPRRIFIQAAEVDGSIRVEVADTGPGVKPEDESKLFQPFFTTKPVGQGTGLGLSVSYGIIESHGGTIGYRTNTWGGATFYFEIPLGDQQDTRDGTDLLHRAVSD